MSTRSSSSDSLFRAIPMPERLSIPAPAVGRGRPLHCKPIGTAVSPGEQLTTEQTETDAVALAPLSGTILGSSRTSLMNGDLVEAIDIRTTEQPPLPAEAPKGPAQRPVLRFTDLGPWIDRLLKAGISAFRTCSPD